MRTLTPPQWTDSPSPQIAPLTSGASAADGIRFLKRIGYSIINTHANDNSAFFYEAGFIVDADDSPRHIIPTGQDVLTTRET